MNGLKKLIRIAVLTVVVSGVVLGAAGTASADSISSNGSVSSANAGGDGRTHTVSVAVSALQMTGFDNGQNVDYQVIAQDVTSTPGPFKYYSWQGPYLVNGIQWHDGYFTGTFSTSGPTTVGSFTFNGLAGHHYHVWVDVAYWTGSAWSYVMVPINSYLNTIYSNGIAFTLTNSFALA